MKRAFFLLTAGLTLSCASMNIEGRDWYLTQVIRGGAAVDVDRGQLAANSMSDWLSVHFADGLVSGCGAPNRFRADCKLGGGGSIHIGVIASSMMMAFREPEAIKEREYFALLERVNRWKMPLPGRLELLFTGENGESGMLVYGPTK